MGEPSKRKDPLLYMSDLYETMKALECPVCYEMPKEGNIYQCPNGHMHCNACHSRLDNCPICRVPIGNARNLALETVLSTLPNPCRFNEQGCDIQLPKEALQVHERVCLFRDVPCPSFYCDKKMPLTQLLEHLEEDNHQYKVVEGESYSGALEIGSDTWSDESAWKVTHLKFNDKHFFFSILREKSGFWYFWVYLAEQEEICRNYVFTFKFLSSDRLFKTKFTGPSSSLYLKTKGRKGVVPGGYLVFDDEVAKHFVNEKSELPYYVKVRSFPTEH